MKRIAIGLLVLLGLIYFQAPSAGSRTEPRADLVAVINMNPANPLGGEIWLMNLSGKLVRRITKNNYHEEQPKFSPDGSKIAFVRNMGGLVSGVGIDPKHNEIFVYDLRTGAEIRLTNNSVEDGDPEWSYDSRAIAFYSRRNHPEGRATLWIMEADGSRPRQILPLEQGDLSHLDLEWAPDGIWLAFVNYREEGGMRYSRIEKVRRDGTQRTVVSSGGKFTKSTETGLGDLDLTYSPDGAIIWSARRLENGIVRLFSYSAGAYYGGKAEVSVEWAHHPEASERNPRFSPDGNRILLTRSSPKTGHRSRQLVLTDGQSSFRRHLTSHETWDLWHPHWQPLAHSGAEKDVTSTVVSYNFPNPVTAKGLLAQKGEKDLFDSPAQNPEGVRLVGGRARPGDARASQIVGFETRWKLDVPPDRVTSLTLRFQGRPTGDEVEKSSLRFQLMDWEGKSWVTVLVGPEVSQDKVKILHEMAPANFISRDKREVLLRVVASQASSVLPIVETDYLGLDVRHNAK